jgi:hypothetical protein
MPPGYRRRILIEPHPGKVTAELEDDYHRMVVALTHRDGVVTEVTSEMKRSPWTLCPGAMAQLAATFTGTKLAGFPKRGEKLQNCTHLHDLALFGAAHADETASVAYDILVTDPVDGFREAHLQRNGQPVLDWKLQGDLFLAPAILQGRRLTEMNDWIATLDKAGAEAARILRWASFVASGRGRDMPAGMPATAFPGSACYNFQPERAPHSTRRPGADIDFSLPGKAPMADRAEAFA